MYVDDEDKPLYFGMLVYVDDVASIRADLALWFAQYEIYFDPEVTLQVDITAAPKLAARCQQTE